MSETVSKAVQLTGGAGAQETAEFIGMADKLFDCVNVSSLSEGKLHLYNLTTLPQFK